MSRRPDGTQSRQSNSDGKENVANTSERIHTERTGADPLIRANEMTMAAKLARGVDGKNASSEPWYSARPSMVVSVQARSLKGDK